MFVLDTDVISRSQPVTQGRSVAEWLLRHRGQSFLSVVALGEMRFGVERLNKRGATRKAALLEGWLRAIANLFEVRLLRVDARVADRAGELLARAEANGVSPGFADACFAASARLAGCEVVTFNARRFSALDVPFRAPEDEP